MPYNRSLYTTPGAALDSSVIYDDTDSMMQSEINARQKVYVSSVTLTYSSWSGNGPYSQTVSIPSGTSASKIDIQLTPAQITQLVSDGVFGLLIENNNATFTAKAIGAAPTTTMTVQITRTETN